MVKKERKGEKEKGRTDRREEKKGKKGRTSKGQVDGDPFALWQGCVLPHIYGLHIHCIHLTTMHHKQPINTHTHFETKFRHRRKAPVSCCTTTYDQHTQQSSAIRNEDNPLASMAYNHHCALLLRTTKVRFGYRTNQGCC